MIPEHLQYTLSEDLLENWEVNGSSLYGTLKLKPSSICGPELLLWDPDTRSATWVHFSSSLPLGPLPLHYQSVSLLSLHPIFTALYLKVHKGQSCNQEGRLSLSHLNSSPNDIPVLVPSNLPDTLVLSCRTLDTLTLLPPKLNPFKTPLCPVITSKLSIFVFKTTQRPQDVLPQTHLCKPSTAGLAVSHDCELWAWGTYSLTLISCWFSRSSQYPQSFQSLHDCNCLQHNPFSIKFLKQFLVQHKEYLTLMHTPRPF